MHDLLKYKLPSHTSIRLDFSDLASLWRFEQKKPEMTEEEKEIAE